MEKLKADVRADIIEQLRDGVGAGEYGGDLHNELCNSVPYIIGTCKAKEWLGSHVFDVIELVKDWEQDNIGEVTTDFSDPERVANMAAFVLGSEILQESETLSKCWNCVLEDADLLALADELASSSVEVFVS